MEISQVFICAVAQINGVGGLVLAHLSENGVILGQTQPTMETGGWFAVVAFQGQYFPSDMQKYILEPVFCTSSLFMFYCFTQSSVGLTLKLTHVLVGYVDNFLL